MPGFSQIPRIGASGIIAFDPVPPQNCLRMCSETLDIVVPGGDEILTQLRANPRNPQKKGSLEQKISGKLFASFFIRIPEFKRMAKH